ncbi:MAG TPA: hypothetical protein VFA18_14080 [Gemmataceae bacterium]|nr:hypothetical protein [Gemmataceae bacterium]
MLLLSKLKIGAGLLLLMAALVLKGAACALLQPAQAAPPGDDRSARGKANSTQPSNPVGKQSKPTGTRQAVFVFRGADKGKKFVSLLVAGTAGPVFCLPVGDTVQVLVGQQSVGFDGLWSGCRVTIQLDSTEHVIQKIWALERPQRTVVLKEAKDLVHLQGPSAAEVIHALKLPHNVPTILDVHRDNVQVITEEFAKHVDPPKVYPLVGEASLCHSYWKCTVYYDEVVEASWPSRLIHKRPRVHRTIRPAFPPWPAKLGPPWPGLA